MLAFIVTKETTDGKKDIKVVTPLSFEKEITKRINDDFPDKKDCVKKKTISEYSTEILLILAGDTFTWEEYNKIIDKGVKICIDYSELSPLKYAKIMDTLNSMLVVENVRNGNFVTEEKEC